MNKQKLLIIVALGTVGGGSLLLLRSSQTSLSTDSNQTHSTQNTVVSNPFALSGPKVGEKIPEFSIITIEGISLTSTNTVGKILVFTSSATWCPTCIIENKEFKSVYEETKGKGVEFITVDIDPITTVEDIKDFQKKYAPWNNTHVSQSKQLIDDLVLNRFEITYLVDREGVIRFKDGQITSTEVLKEEMGKLL